MNWTASDLPSFAGRRVIVTGANSGLGLVTARELARVGASVTLAVRNLDKGHAAAAQMTGDVTVARLDLQSLDSIREFATGVDGVDVLVNNAGIMAVPFALTADGFESQIGTNHLGHFALTNLLLPKITDRVVTVASLMHLLGWVDLKDLNWKSRPYLAWPAYGQSKLANLLFTSALQRRLAAAGSPVRAIAAHPATPPRTCRARPGTRSVPRCGWRRTRSPPMRTSAPGRRCSPCPRMCPATASSARSSGCGARPAPARVAHWLARCAPPRACGNCRRSSRVPNFGSEHVIGYPC